MEVRNAGHYRIETAVATNGATLELYDFGMQRVQQPRILVLKLDHRGDFLIGLPAIERLRRTFPDSHLTLICGTWNLSTAQDLGIADEIRGYNFFPEVMDNWNGDPVEGIERFRNACRGRFDIAVDLRVDEDTRPLLQHVDAGLLCGIGSRARHPFLNIILPGESRLREVPPLEADALAFTPCAFLSRMPIQTPFFHETDFSISDIHLVYGPYERLPVGNLRADFGFQLSAPAYCRSRRVEIAVEAVRGGEVVAFERIREVLNHRLTTVALEFANDDPAARYEFRVFVGGRPRHSRLRFFGVSIKVLEKIVHSRLVPAELHHGEELSLLVQLIAERTRPLHRPEIPELLVGRACEAGPQTGRLELGRYIVIAPFSSSKLKDWPLDRYVTLIELLLGHFEDSIVLVGSQSQEPQLSQIGKRYGDTERLVNLAGRTDWAGLAAVLRRAGLVIANDSGVAHLAAACGSPTLAIYSGANRPQEWGPRGEVVRVIAAAVKCSPCGYDRLDLCQYGHLCMTLIEPETVLRLALEMLGQHEQATQPQVTQPRASVF
jgi:ADP-heptose:LPS heptosyltransferase